MSFLTKTIDQLIDAGFDSTRLPDDTKNTTNQKDIKDDGGTCLHPLWNGFKQTKEVDRRGFDCTIRPVNDDRLSVLFFPVKLTCW